MHSSLSSLPDPQQEEVFLELNPVRGPPALHARQIGPIRNPYQGMIAPDMHATMKHKTGMTVSPHGPVDDGTQNQTAEDVLSRLGPPSESIPLAVREPSSTKPVQHVLKPAFKARPPSTFNYSKVIERANREGKVLRGPRSMLKIGDATPATVGTLSSDVKSKKLQERYLITGLNNFALDHWGN